MKKNEEKYLRKDIIKEHFSNTAEQWNSLYDNSDQTNTFTKFELKKRKEIVFSFIDKIKSTEKIIVLDLGCGSGQYLTQLHSMGFRTIGADISEEMLHLTKRKFSNANADDIILINSDCYKLPFEKNRFDIVLCIGVLEYLDNEKTALAEIKRILKPDGHIILTFPNFYKLRNLLNPYYYLIRIWTYLLDNKPSKAYKKNGVQIDYNKSTVTRYSLSKAKKIVVASGFEILDIKGYAFGPFSVWKNSVFSFSTSIKISNIVEGFASNGILGFLKFFSNRWVLLLKLEKS